MDYMYVLLFVVVFILMIYVKKTKKQIVKENKKQIVKENTILIDDVKIEKVNFSKRNTKTISTTGIIGYHLNKDKVGAELKPKWIEVKNYEENENKENNEEALSVLLVDDSLVIRKYVENLCKTNNLKINSLENGEEALAYLTEHKDKVKILITDIEMPKLNGLELIEKLKEFKIINNLKIIVLSANVESHLDLLPIDDIDGIVRKPFNDVDLLNQIAYLSNLN